MLNFASDVKRSWPESSLSVHRCTFESKAGGVAIRNSHPYVIADIRDCDFIGAAIVIQGRRTLRNCRLNGKALPDILRSAG